MMSELNQRERDDPVAFTSSGQEVVFGECFSSGCITSF